jgi:hypothetical protein
LSTLSPQVARLRIFGIILGLLMAGGALNACGSDDSPKAASISSGALDKQILDLSQGMSLAVVESRLGEPAYKVTVENEVILSYGPWRLVAEDGHLKRRIRSRRNSQTAVSWSADHDSKALDQKILAIRPGTSIVKVRKTLGAPEQNEEVFEGIAHPLVVLGYGAWTLSFRDGELKERTKS